MALVNLCIQESTHLLENSGNILNYTVGVGAGTQDFVQDAVGTSPKVDHPRVLCHQYETSRAPDADVKLSQARFK